MMHWMSNENNPDSNNPWNVTNLDEFLYFCCPECDLKNQSKVQFLQHALEKHPKAKECVQQFNEFVIKDEPSELEDAEEENLDIDNEIYTPEPYDTSFDYSDMLKCEIKDEKKDLSTNDDDSSKPTRDLCIKKENHTHDRDLRAKDYWVPLF